MTAYSADSDAFYDEDEEEDNDEGGVKVDVMPTILEETDIEEDAGENDKGAVEFDAMSFTYDESDTKVVAGEDDKQDLKCVMIIKPAGELYEEHEMRYEFVPGKRM